MGMGIIDASWFMLDPIRYSFSLWFTTSIDLFGARNRVPFGTLLNMIIALRRDFYVARTPCAQMFTSVTFELGFFHCRICVLDPNS